MTYFNTLTGRNLLPCNVHNHIQALHLQ